MTVYILRCKATGAVYVGKTARSLRVRMLEHRREARQCRRPYPLYAAIREFGWESFTAAEVHQAQSEDELNRIERRLIKSYRTQGQSLNLSECGGGGLDKFERSRPARISKAQRKRISEGVRISWRELRGAA